MQKELFVGNSVLHTSDIGGVTGEYVSILGDEFYRIGHYDRMQPFFMSIVSNSDHWMFISSTGGLSAGRSNAESAIFPYYTDDKITENHPNTGSVSIFQIKRGQKTYLWEPFSSRFENLYQIERNIYKNILGNQLIFEEINYDLHLMFRTIWRTSEKFGFAKTSWIINTANSECNLEIIDGLQNILPYGATTALQTAFSNLLNAYKRAELEPVTGLGIFSLSSTLTDLAEPSESLKATVAWQYGLENPYYLLSTQQLDSFRSGADLTPELDIRGSRGAYLVNASFGVAAGKEKEWTIVSDVNQDGNSIAKLLIQLEQNSGNLFSELKHDIELGSADLRRIVASADGLQVSKDRLSTAHHFSNVLFNCMRGGIFAENYLIQKNDFLDFIKTRNQAALLNYPEFFAALPETFNSSELISRAATIQAAADIRRLCFEYLPLTFSRRHGDPSRPWNKFSINLRKPDGSRRLDYQGNWRDIFQNWEPLAWSYPEFIEAMVCKFLNATTADGYNPYRVTRDGVEWEAPTPNDPWANIGYWGDHQIVYLESLLEISHRFHPGRLEELLGEKIFSHANVPYHIKPYADLLIDPFATIIFDRQCDDLVKSRIKSLGTDGRLLLNSDGQVFHVTLLEKLMTLLLAKLANFVPDGGIWMNTQRPEWNDANNALVGKGLSMVTLGYLRRFMVFTRQLLLENHNSAFMVTAEIADFFSSIASILQNYSSLLHANSGFEPDTRRQVMDALGQAGSTYRTNYYQNGFSDKYKTLQKAELSDFLSLSLEYIEQSLKNNQRPDKLFHSYNILQLKDREASIKHLDPMLEGQVSILGSGLLSSAEALSVLDNLRNSALFRQDQLSYTLYPDRNLPGFIQKNLIEKEKILGSKLIEKLIDQKDQRLISQDLKGNYHFNGTFKNARDVKAALSDLRKSETYQELVDSETEFILELFEGLFKHDAFTGRSGTFFAYEGLGSIYWHMVSKLMLAVQENFFHAVEIQAPTETTQQLSKYYYEIRSGLGFNKSPDIYGAFPTDPYSHTPAGQGAKQPGLTGQVKEEILTRLRELGIFVNNGQIFFNPILLRPSELLVQPEIFTYIAVNGLSNEIELLPGSCACTLCQVPMVIQSGADQQLKIIFSDNSFEEFSGNNLDVETSKHIFERDNHIKQITFTTLMR